MLTAGLPGTGHWWPSAIAALPVYDPLHTGPSGFQILLSPTYQWMILDKVDTQAMRAVLLRLDRYIESLGYQVEDWSVNPIFIIKPDGWVMPQDQELIRDWLMRQEECRYVRTQRDKNKRLNTMHIEIVHQSKVPVELAKLHIS